MTAIDKLVASHEVDASQPGVAILIHQPGKPLFKKGYGLANLNTSDPITAHTMFELASCSKPFTALAVLLLHDRKLLSIDQDVGVLLPELPVYRYNTPDTFIYASPDVPAAKDGCNHAIGYEWRTAKSKWKATWGTPPDRNEKELIVGDGSIWTNLEDMLKWDQAIRARKFIRAERWQLALTPATTNNGKAIEYGLGWMLDFSDANRIDSFGHNGSWGGFMTSYWHSNDIGRTTVLLSNRDEFDVDEFMAELDALVEQHP